MIALKAIVAKIVGLFVDSATFAAAILAWLVIAGACLSRSAILAPYAGPILFLGLLAILLHSVASRARRHPGS